MVSRIFRSDFRGVSKRFQSDFVLFGGPRICHQIFGGCPESFNQIYGGRPESAFIWFRIPPKIWWKDSEHPLKIWWLILGPPKSTKLHFFVCFRSEWPASLLFPHFFVSHGSYSRIKVFLRYPLCKDKAIFCLTELEHQFDSVLWIFIILFLLSFNGSAL